MERIYTSLSFVYRFLIIAITIAIHYQLVEKAGKGIDTNIMIFYASIIVYAIAFSLFKVNKWVSYVELMTVLGLIYYYEHNLLYFLLLLPFVSLVSSKAGKRDMLFFTGIVSGFFFISGIELMSNALISSGIYVTLSVFHSKFSQIEFLQSAVYALKKEIEKLSIELGNKQREIEITSNMFVHSKNLSETIEVEELMQQMVDSSRDFFNAQYACLYMKRNDEFYLEKESGKNERFEVPEEISLEEANNIRIENKLIRMTIDYEGEAWGIMAVYGKRDTLGDGNQLVPFPFREEDFEILSVYITMAMSPIKHAKLLKTMNYLANNDFLTGIANRRYFVEQFDYLRKMAKRGQDLALLLLDVDHFKSFNDQFGHDVGDEVLRQVAETLKYTIREVDVVGRLGGEEFAILLPSVGENAEYVAERIRRRIENIPFERQITVSIGISNFETDGVTWEDLYKKADEALYHAKETGRNKVVTYGEF